MSKEKMNDAEIGVMVSTWKWRIPKAGYKTIKEFSIEIGVPDSQFSLWVNGKQRPMQHNIDKVESALKEKGV